MRPLDVFVGIDPGLDGWLAAVYQDGEVAFTRPTPTIPTGQGAKRAYSLPDMLSLLPSREVCPLVVVEQQQAMPGQGGTSMFAVGYGYGLWRMALVAADLSHREVRPAEWKRAAGLGSPKGADKNAKTKARKALAVAKVQALYPSLDLRASERARTPCPDKAEAILLARYARHLALGVPL